MSIIAKIFMAAALSVTLPLAPVKRISDKPILSPRKDCFDNLAAYNPTALYYGGADSVTGVAETRLESDM